MCISLSLNIYEDDEALKTIICFHPTSTVCIYFISSLDLTKQKFAEDKQKALIESSPEAMLEIDEKGTIVLANSAATEIFGWTNEELIGSNVNLIVGGDHAKEHSKYLSRYLATGEKRVMGKSRELPARRKDGSEFPIRLGLTEMVLKDGHRVFCGE